MMLNRFIIQIEIPACGPSTIQGAGFGNTITRLTGKINSLP